MTVKHHDLTMAFTRLFQEVTTTRKTDNDLIWQKRMMYLAVSLIVELDAVQALPLQVPESTSRIQHFYEMLTEDMPTGAQEETNDR